MDSNQYDEPLNQQPSVDKPRSILFVCSNNTCRGPMAAALFKRRRPADYGCIVRSAGTGGRDGRPVIAAAQDVLHRRGIDLSHHGARMITSNLLPAFDLILAMEESHREWIGLHCPEAAPRTWRLGHWRDMEFPRRANGHYADFERLADEIELCIGDWNQRFGISSAGSPRWAAGAPGAA